MLKPSQLRHFALLMCCSLGVAGCASVNDEFDNFSYAALTPIRDLNIAKPPIPDQLRGLQNPFGYTYSENCDMWRQEIQELNTAITQNENRRVGSRRDNDNFAGRFGNFRDVGVRMLATSFTPYRGALRQVSGASAFQKEADRASHRARIRIGVLAGRGQAYRCPGFTAIADDYK